MHQILLGPILGYEWEASSQVAWYTIIIRTTASAPIWEIDGNSVAMTDLSGLLHDKTRIWRGELALSGFQMSSDTKVAYRIQSGGNYLKNVCADDRWEFLLPARQTPSVQPRIAFCSCNGFTDLKTLGDRAPLAMWNRMLSMHKKAPFHLLIMGGDQLYCDDLARTEGGFSKFWAWLDPKKKPHATPTPGEFKKAYFDHYLLAWSRITYDGNCEPHASMVRIMASVPSLMVWDDHDIFDGWGSYQASDKTQPYHKESFSAAKEAFEIYQIRGARSNRSLLDKTKSSPRHYSQAVSFGDFDILLMDNRSHRTPDQVMDRNQWRQTEDWLNLNRKHAGAGKKTLLIVSPVPVIYRRFFDWVTELPGEHGGEDDLRDHWSHSRHEGERDRLISHLFESLENPNLSNPGYGRIVILSGDVHVGALGFLEESKVSREIVQLISSAIINAPPTVVAWEGLKAISTDDDFSIKGQGIVAKMVRPVGARDRYLRCRNFLWLRGGDDGRLWANWECEQARPDEPARVEFGIS
jgi:hypothetical protein